jgi:hypothetical protein
MINHFIEAGSYFQERKWSIEQFVYLGLSSEHIFKVFDKDRLVEQKKLLDFIWE